jgi:hypothetical protein
VRCPSDALAASARAAAPSSYFFVGGRFFTDGRAPLAADVGAQVAAFCRAASVAAPLHLLPVAGGGAAGARGGGQGGCSAAAAGTPQAGAAPNEEEGAAPQPTRAQQEQEAPAEAGSSSGGGGGGGGGGVPSARMEATRLVDLKLAVANRPTYLYCHQGCCEHGWFVSDVRLRHALDPPRRAPEAGPPPAAAEAPGPSSSSGGGGGGAAVAQYPRVLFRAPPSPRWRCGVCGKAGVVAVVAGHPAAPEDPCLVCPGCRELLLPPPGDGGGAAAGAAWHVYSLL